tara:strand:+ start:1207 stop:4125 length:2919 start_codon:yes stop_codon:yes gene_type:complete
MISPTEKSRTSIPKDKLDDALRQVASGWLSKIELSKEARSAFDEVSEQCTAFFQSAVSFMWEPDFRRKFLGTDVSPNFHVTLNKAFELVSIYGPTLYWQNPERMLTPRKHMPVVPELFGVDPNLQQQLNQQLQQLNQQLQQVQQQSAPVQQQLQQAMESLQPQIQQAQQQGIPPEQAQMMLMQQNPQAMQAQQQSQQLNMQMQQLNMQIQQIQQQLQQQQAAQQAFAAKSQEQHVANQMRGIRAGLMQNWLNYTPGEQPGGGLETAAMKAITESLVKGRGCLMPEAYTMPGSETKLTGCTYISVDDLFLDPDATGLGPNECWWMAVRRTQPVWYVERKFNLKGKLHKSATYERRSSFGERFSQDLGNNDRAMGKTHDTITYYEIWSKSGAGHRLAGLKSEYHDAFEKIGDYARIVVAPGVDYPLNTPPGEMKSASTDEIKKMMEWEYPFWKDDRWPVVCLDYWHRVPDKDPQGSAWPIAPLEPGLGELITLNVLVSHIVNRTWSSSRDFIAVLQSAQKDVEKWLKKGQDMTVFPVKEIYGDINKVVQWVQQPQMKADMWQVITMLTDLFEKRVGLSELLYGMTAHQSRSAADAETKRSQMNIRPDHMAKQVEHWMEQCARQEKMVARWTLEAKDIKSILGETEAQMWTQFITNAPVEETVREVECHVTANSVRKPNKERESANMAQVMSVAMPEFSKHADATTDTGPLNKLLSKWGKSIDQDMDDFQIGPRAPAPNPEQQQAQQQQAANIQKQFDLQMQLLQVKAQSEQQKMQTQMQVEQAKLQGLMIRAQADMAKAQTAQQEAAAKTQLDQAKIALAQLQGQIRRQEADLIARTRAEQHRLEMQIRDEQRRQNTEDFHARMARDQGSLDHEMRLEQEKHEADMLQDAEKHIFDIESGGNRFMQEQALATSKAERDDEIDYGKATAATSIQQGESEERTRQQQEDIARKARERMEQQREKDWNEAQGNSQNS